MSKLRGPKGAIPTTRGWVNAKGELLKAQKISEELVNEWHGITTTPIQTLHEAPVNETTVNEETYKFHAEDVDDDGLGSKEDE